MITYGRMLFGVIIASACVASCDDGLRADEITTKYAHGYERWNWELITRWLITSD